MRTNRSRRLAGQTVGLPFDVVKRSAPETILQLLESGGATKDIRGVRVAELLLQDAELSDTTGKNRDAAVARAQARALLARSIDNLSPDEQAVYRPKLAALNIQLSEPESSDS
ncbi:MAG: hypothetical protein QOI96_15 [Verrucomicrobiota bacterium]